MMTIEASDAVLLRKSLAMVCAVRTTTAALFYDRLFTLDPRLRSLFHSDMDHQGAKFLAMLQFVVGTLDQPQTVQDAAARLGHAHAGYGVLDEHYEVVGEALLWALAQCLGPAYTQETAAAWTKLYRLLADRMKEAAQEKWMAAEERPDS